MGLITGHYSARPNCEDVASDEDGETKRWLHSFSLKHEGKAARAECAGNGFLRCDVF